MSIQLTVMSLDFDSSGTPSTRTYNKDEITLGRFPENDVILDKPEVSGIHAKLRVVGGENGEDSALYITDLGSSNGTLVENNSLDSQVEVAMHPNERIIIGNYLIKPTVFKGRVETSSEAEAFTSETSEANTAGENGQQAHAFGAHTIETGAASVGPGLLFSAQENTEEDSLDVSIQTPNEEINLDDSPTLQMSVEELEQAANAASEPTETEASEQSVEQFASSETPEPVLHTDTSTKITSSEPRTITINLDGSDVLNLDFDAVALFDVSGTITHRGEALEGVTIEAGSLGNTRTDSRGQFRFENIEEGTHYSITARKDGYSFTADAASGTVSSDISVPFVATRLFSIRGLVTHKGKPLAGASIDGGNLGFRTTGGDGSFSYEGVEEFTKFRVSVSKENFIFSAEKDSGEVGDADQSLHFTARQLFTISGQITNRGVPLAGVEVDGGSLGKTTTGADGYYRFENVPEGEEYRVTASKERFRLNHQE